MRPAAPLVLALAACGASRNETVVPDGRDVDRAIAAYEAPRARASSRTIEASPHETRTIAEPPPDRPPIRARNRRPIDVELHDADLANAFRILAEAAGLNVVVEGKLDVRITASLKHVDPVAAMEAIARANGAELAREGDIVFVRKR